MKIYVYCRFDMFIGYIRQNENKTEQMYQYQLIQSFAKELGIKLDCIYSDYAFANIKEIIFPGAEGVIIYNISALGAGLAEIKDNLLFCRKHKLQIHSVEDGYHFDENNLTADFFKGVDVAINVRSNLISQNVKKVLKQRKDEGIKLGRPTGALGKKRLEGKEIEIRRLLAQKVSKTEIARRFKVTRNTVFNFVKRNGLEQNSNNEINE